MRPINRLLSLLLGLALILGGLLAVVETAAFAANGDTLLVPVENWLGNLRTATFSDRVPLIVFSALTAAGLVLLVAELYRSGPRRVALPADGPGTWWVLRRSVERDVRDRLTDRGGARSARARLRPAAGNGAWRLDVSADADPEDTERIEGESRRVLSQLGAPEGSDVRARVRSGRRVN